MKLAKYIFELLLDNETVIIPGFGAFISIYKPAEIFGNEIKPPSREISFTQQVKNNDGLLVGTVARIAKISQLNALKRIERERENLLYQLDKGETVVLENIGNLFYNEISKIQFVPFNDHNLLLDSFGLEPISMEDVVEKTIETESSEVLIEMNEPIAVTHENYNETGIADEIESEPAGRSKEENSIPGFPSEIITEREKEINSVSEQELKSFRLPEYMSEPNEKPGPNVKPKENKKTNWYWFLLILILIFTAGYFILQNIVTPEKPVINQKESTKNKQQGIQIKTMPPTDSTKNDSIIKAKVAVLDIVKPQGELSQKKHKYYLVGGGFKSEENVEKYILLLKEKGIEGISLGKKGSMYLVGIESFDTENEALKSLNEHSKTDPGWNLWVYKK